MEHLKGLGTVKNAVARKDLPETNTLAYFSPLGSKEEKKFYQIEKLVKKSEGNKWLQTSWKSY